VKNKIHRYITNDGTIRVSSVVCTDVINEARKIHDAFPVATAALGRALIGAGLLASFMKDEGRMALYFKGDGPVGNFFAEGDSDGAIRGFITNPQVHVPSVNGKLNVGGAVGKGMLSVATSLPNEKSPYTGTVQIQSGEIGEDIAYYLFQSQQTPSIVALGVFVEPDYSVTAAGGTILQVLPGATEQTLTTLEKRVAQMRSVTEIIRSGGGVEELVFEVLEDFSFRKIDDSLAFRYECQCSLTKVERSLLLLGEDELKALVRENKPAEVRCDFCGKKYDISLATLGQLMSAAGSKS
jgi:molecular chaperone Hsp33